MTVIEPPNGWLELDLPAVARYRTLLGFLAWREIKVRYKQTLIGIAWAVAQPLLQMVVFTVFFGRLAGVPSDGLPYPVFFLAGLVPWAYFAGALTACTNVVVDNQRLVTKVYFPRLILPIAAVLPPLVDLAFALLLALVFELAFGVHPGVAILFVPFFIIFAVATALAVGLWLSALNAIYRDVRFVVPFLVQLWMFASPVVYSSTLVPERWRWAFALNPMTGVIDGFRWALTQHGPPPSLSMGVSALVVVLLLVGGLAFFRRKEAIIADLV